MLLNTHNTGKVQLCIQCINTTQCTYYNIHVLRIARVLKVHLPQETLLYALRNAYTVYGDMVLQSLK